MHEIGAQNTLKAPPFMIQLPAEQVSLSHFLNGRQREREPREGWKKSETSRENERECMRDTAADNDSKIDTRTHTYMHILSLCKTQK